MHQIFGNSTGAEAHRINASNSKFPKNERLLIIYNFLQDVHARATNFVGRNRYFQDASQLGGFNEIQGHRTDCKNDSPSIRRLLRKTTKTCKPLGSGSFHELEVVCVINNPGSVRILVIDAEFRNKICARHSTKAFPPRYYSFYYRFSIHLQ